MAIGIHFNGEEYIVSGPVDEVSTEVARALTLEQAVSDAHTLYGEDAIINYTESVAPTSAEPTPTTPTEE